MTDKDVKLVHEEGYDEIININIVDENSEPIVEILRPEKTVIDNNLEIETANLECDKKTVGEQDKVDKITEGSLQDNRNVDLQYERTRLEEIKNFQNDIYINVDLQYERTRLEDIENFQNDKVRKENQQEGRLNPSGRCI